jgi:O-antigen ligase
MLTISNQDQKKQNMPGIANAFPFITVLFNTEITLRKPSHLTITQASTAFLQDPTQLIILGIAYLSALACLVHRLEKSFNILSNHKVYLIMLLYILMSSLWSQFPLKVFIAWGHFVGFSLVALAASYYFESKPGALANTLTFFGFIILIASIPVSLFLPKIGVDALTGRWQGITANPNHLGIVAFVLVWATLTSFTFSHHRVKGILLLVLSLIALWGCRSITSIIIAVFISSFYLFFVVFKQKKDLNTVLVKIAALCAMLLMFLASLYVIDPSLVGPVGFNKMTGRDITLTGRWRLWKTGFALFLDKPILGWSYDVLLSVFAKKNITQGQFHNGYLDLVIRGGLVGLFLFFSVFMRIIKSLWIYISNNYEQVLMCLALLTGIMVHNISEASFVRAPNVLWLLFITIYFMVGKSKSKLNRYDIHG